MKAKYIVIFLLSLLPPTACDKEGVVIPTTAPCAVLIYFAGDNSLSEYMSQNLRTIKEGIERDGLNNGSLLIYTDEQDEAPQSLQLKLEADTIRQAVLETYASDQDSASTETLTQVIDKVQREYPADSYGLVLWSHGTGQLPSDTYSYLRFFRQDGKNNFMEIDDSVSTLLKCHFGLTLSDACYMSYVEITYAFQERTDHIIGLPMEVLTSGFSHQTIMRDMFKKKADVVGIATKFHAYYQSETGTISVMKSNELDELAAICHTLFHDRTEGDLFAIPVSELQIMEYLAPNYHALCDFDDYVSRLAAEEQYNALKRNMEKVVIYKATTPKVVYVYPCPCGNYPSVNKYSGLSIYVP